MTRPLRMAVANGWYHVYGRGIERRDIFADDRDRQHWLELLEEVHLRYRFVIHAFTLMDNHHHTIIRTPDANLSRGMQWLHGSYSAWFNTRHQRVGPLFQGRFGAVPVQSAYWAYRLSFYVHMNPLRIAGFGLDKRGRLLESKGWVSPGREQISERLTMLRTYPWSSYRAYAGYVEQPAWLNCEELLKQTADKSNPHAAYRRQTRQTLTRGNDVSLMERLNDALAIGTAGFAAQIRGMASAGALSGISGKREFRRGMDIEEIRGHVETIRGESWTVFGHRYGDWGCALFVWGARKLCGLTLSEIGEAAGGLNFSAVSKLISRFESAAAENSFLRDLQRRLIEMSNVEP